MALSEHVSERAEARLGSVLRGKWKLDRIIGVGGMATVYSATHRNSSRVAIKMLHPEVAIDADVTSRFLREGYVANIVDHPGTVKVLDDDMDGDAPFLVMELLEGETLEARSKRKGGTLDVAEVLAIGDQILSVLSAAHDKQIVHRDLKPENLFLTRTGELKILDFGIARLREPTKDGNSSTRDGSLLGTPGFMAPEQARGRWEEVDCRTDIWAVGATLFTLLAGRQVHEAETLQEQLIRSATTPAVPIGSVCPELPPAIGELIDRALAFDKTQRWESARRMQDALRASALAIEGGAPLTLPAPSSPVNDASTLIAPPELTSAITGRLYTTARPVTGVSQVSGPARGTPWIAVGSAVAFLCVLGSLLLWRFGGRAPAAEPIDTRARVAAAPAATLQPIASAPETAVVAPSAAPVATPVPPKPSASAKPSRVRTTSTTAGKSDKPATGGPRVEPKQETNPFDRRL